MNHRIDFFSPFRSCSFFRSSPSSSYFHWTAFFSICHSIIYYCFARSFFFVYSLLYTNTVWSQQIVCCRLLCFLYFLSQNFFSVCTFFSFFFRFHLSPFFASRHLIEMWPLILFGVRNTDQEFGTCVHKFYACDFKDSTMNEFMYFLSSMNWIWTNGIMFSPIDPLINFCILWIHRLSTLRRIGTPFFSFWMRKLQVGARKMKKFRWYLENINSAQPGWCLQSSEREKKLKRLHAYERWQLEFEQRKIE